MEPPDDWHLSFHLQHFRLISIKETLIFIYVSLQNTILITSFYLICCVGLGNCDAHTPVSHGKCAQTQDCGLSAWNPGA